MGYVDNKPSLRMPIKYLGDDNFFLDNFSPKDFNIIVGIVYPEIVDLTFRKEIISKFRDFDGKTLISKSALITHNSKIGNGTVLFEHSLINRSIIGKHCVINSGSIIEHDCIIGDNVFIGPGVIIGGGVKVENDTFIGSGAIIRDSISISQGTTIGMGTVVTKDLIIKGLYFGNPSKLVTRF
jgi:sugar O-acyltransferase (sialic acid O-acetyltransferase NeuD family)